MTLKAASSLQMVGLVLKLEVTSSSMTSLERVVKLDSRLKPLVLTIFILMLATVESLLHQRNDTNDFKSRQFIANSKYKCLLRLKSPRINRTLVIYYLQFFQSTQSSGTSRTRVP